MFENKVSLFSSPVLAQTGISKFGFTLRRKPGKECVVSSFPTIERDLIASASTLLRLRKSNEHESGFVSYSLTGQYRSDQVIIESEAELLTTLIQGASRHEANLNSLLQLVKHVLSRRSEQWATLPASKQRQITPKVICPGCRDCQFASPFAKKTWDTSPEVPNNLIAGTPCIYPLPFRQVFNEMVAQMATTALTS